MKSDQKLIGWPGFDLNDFMQWRTAREDPLTLVDLLDSLFWYFAISVGGGTEYLGNKKGSYASGHAPLTKRLFPDAKFIYTVRDPRDVVRSMGANFTGCTPESEVAICAIRSCYISRMCRTYPEDCLELKYEDLVLTPMETCSQICAFLGISFESGMLEFYKRNQEGQSLLGHTAHIHPNTQTPFNPELIGQWQRKGGLTASQVEDIEIINREYMIKYGYEFHTKCRSISSASMLLKSRVRLWKARMRSRIR